MFYDIRADTLIFKTLRNIPDNTKKRCRTYTALVMSSRKTFPMKAPVLCLLTTNNAENTIGLWI